VSAGEERAIRADRLLALRGVVGRDRMIGFGFNLDRAIRELRRIGIVGVIELSRIAGLCRFVWILQPLGFRLVGQTREIFVAPRQFAGPASIRAAAGGSRTGILGGLGSRWSGRGGKLGTVRCGSDVFFAMT
jgi:hypothetical protein